MDKIIDLNRGFVMRTITCKYLYPLVMDWIVEKTSEFGFLKSLGKKLRHIEEVLNLP